MTAQQFASYVRLKTKTNATTFIDVDILIYANIIKDDICKEISKADEDYFGIEILRDLEVNKRNYGFPSYILSHIKLVQAKLDGTNWAKLEEFDINAYSRQWLSRATTDETTLLSNWAGRGAEFDIFGGEMTIYSDAAMIAVTGGLKLWSIIYPADLTALSGTTDLSVQPSATTFGVPRQLHKVWATKVIIEWKESQDRPIPLTERELNVEVDLQKAVNSLKELNLGRIVIAKAPRNDGSQY